MLTAAAAWLALILVNVILVTATGCSQWDSIHGEVVYANVIFRHGIRAPTEIYPNDPHILNTGAIWPSGLGELTEAGACQHYQLGKWLRMRYGNLLPPNGRYNRSAIHVLSSDVDRCIASAIANMAGMFPHKRSSTLGGLIWPPVPIHTTPEQYDNIIRLSRPCKKYQEELDKFKKSNEYERLMGSKRELFNFASYMSGLNITVQDPRQFGTLYITLYIQELFEMELPRWCREIYPDKMRDVVGLIFAIPTYTQTLQRLRVGYLLNLLLTTMENKYKGSLDPPTQNITVYSAHDSTLASLLHTMGVYNFILPPFAAAILMELRLNQYGQPVVMIFYKNTTGSYDPPILLMNQSLYRLRELWSPLLIEDESKWEAECGN